jgi:hypothetical protein
VPDRLLAATGDLATDETGLKKIFISRQGAKGAKICFIVFIDKHSLRPWRLGEN